MNRLLPPWRAWQTTGLSIAGLTLLTASWFQFSGRKSEAESVLSEPAVVRSALDATGPEPAMATGFDAAESGSGIVQVSASEIVGGPDGGVRSGSMGRMSDGERRGLLTGSWEDEYHGRRYLTVAADGRGKMIVELDGIGKRLFGPRLAFDIEWGVADGMVTLKTLGGEPRAKVQTVLKLYGSEAQYQILELTADRLLLLDGDGKTQYDWRRPGARREPGADAGAEP